MKLKNLENEIKKININKMINLVFAVEETAIPGKKKVMIWDTNEEYDINYEETMNCLLQDIAEEFGHKQEYYIDDVFSKIEKALNKDFSHQKSNLLEWENNVCMVYYFTA